MQPATDVITLDQLRSAVEVAWFMWAVTCQLATAALVLIGWQR